MATWIRSLKHHLTGLVAGFWQHRRLLPVAVEVAVEVAAAVAAAAAMKMLHRHLYHQSPHGAASDSVRRRNRW